MSKNWYIVTNTEDLTDFINYGLIFDEQGFTGSGPVVNMTKDIPKGYISCFSTDNLSPALEKIKTEDENLDCCLLELDIKKISSFTAYGGFMQGNNTIYSQKQGCIQDLEGLEDINCILIPAPLPFTCIKSIIVEDDNTKKKIQVAYKEKFGVKNISFKKMVSLFKIPNNKGQLIESSDSDSDIGEEWKVEQREINYSKLFAYGGALGLLYYQTKNGRKSTKIFEIFSDLVRDTSSSDDTLKTIKPFKNYLSSIQPFEDDVSKLYKRIIDKLLKTDKHGENCQSILSILKNSEVSENYNGKCNGLSKSLEKIIDRTTNLDPEAILDKILITYKDDVDFKNFALLLTMFFLRDHIETMLKYYHTDFTETHYALLAIFFGMTYGVVNIPLEIRRNDELSIWLSYKMAEYAHNIDEDNTVGFKEPAKPLLLYGDIIRSEPTKNHIVYGLYKWLDDKFKNKINQSIVENIQKLPKKGRIENEYVISDGLSDTRLAIKVELLEDYIQQQIKEDTLFDSNEITLAYKKYTK